MHVARLNLQLSLVSWFHGFRVSGFLVSWFLVSWFHPNRGRDRYRYRDRLFNHEHTGWHRSGFWGTPRGVPDFHEVSCVSGFHPNRGRDRYRYRDRLFNHEHTGWHCSGFYPQIYTDYADFWGTARVFGERQGESLIFMKFHGFMVSGFHPNRGRDRYRYRYRDRDRRPATRDIRPATIDRDARVSDTSGRPSRGDIRSDGRSGRPYRLADTLVPHTHWSPKLRRLRLRRSGATKGWD